MKVLEVYGNGEQEMMEAYYQFDKEYPDIKITEED